MMRPACLCLLLALLLTACGGPTTTASAGVTTITLSRGLTSDYRARAPTTHFGPDEAFYCSAGLTNLRANMLVSARWLYRDQLIKRTDYVVTQTGNGFVGFELTNDSPPWPIGAYRVEILVDHVAVGSATFSVP